MYAELITDGSVISLALSCRNTGYTPDGTCYWDGHLPGNEKCISWGNLQ